MFNIKLEDEVETPKTFEGKKHITPKKDFRICANGIDLKLVEGESVEVPEEYLQNLKTEGVI